MILTASHDLQTGSWAGDPCFLLGGGESLSRCDLSKLPDGARVIGCNVAWSLQPDACIVLDTRLIDKMLEDPRWHGFHGRTFVHEGPRWEIGTKPPGVQTYKTRMGSIWSDSLEEGLAPVRNAGVAALQLADVLGSSEVYLLGIDAVPDGDRRCGHWHSEYDRRWWGKDGHVDVIQSFEEASLDVRARVLQASSPTNVRSFREITYDHALERARSISWLQSMRSRLDITEYLAGLGRPVRCAELGVAKGCFSEHLLRYAPNIERLYVVDAWQGHHASDEQAAREKLSHFRERATLIKSTFEDAAPKVADGTLDLVYVDGYAHTGQEGGKTLDDWASKLRPGGILCGHDYSARYQPTIDAVDRFAKKHKLTVFVSEETSRVGMDGEPSWWTVV